MSAHAQRKPAFARRDPTTKNVDIGSTLAFDHLNSFSHAIPELAICKTSGSITTWVAIGGPFDVGGIPRSRCLLAE
jgi:hypothetical protein